MNLNPQQNEKIGKQLHAIGDKIERLAERLKRDGKTAESDELYGLGNEVEHFFDQIDLSEEALDSASPQEKSSSTVNNSQASG